MSRLLVVSGGQSGVDRAALEAAAALGLGYAGWCPRGGWAEDLSRPPGVLAICPALRPTPLRDPGQRTFWNVRDSDATLILLPAPARTRSPGTRRTLWCARLLKRPCHVAVLSRPRAARDALRWLERNRPCRLNVAGPRESEAPGVHATARAWLSDVLSAWVARGRRCGARRAHRRRPCPGQIVGDEHSGRA
jgi:hypothetical protein